MSKNNTNKKNQPNQKKPGGTVTSSVDVSKVDPPPRKKK